MLSTPASNLVEVTRLQDYRFIPMDLQGGRGDIVNKDMPR